MPLCCCCNDGADDNPDREVIVYANDDAANAPAKFPNNFIKTSKYTVLTFVPLNLLFQFRKVSNLYFLVNMIFALVPGVSPINPATAILPLVFVVGVAMIKDGYEDFLRHRADSRANSIPAHVVRMVDGNWELVDVQSMEVGVGDIMMINLGEEIRADVVLFSSSLAEGQAFIDTCNLDGETNLKNRKGTEGAGNLNSVEALTAAQIVLRTSAPNPGLLRWNGVLSIDGNEIAVGLDQFLYRSSVLRNTDWVWGMVAYAGVDTKMFRNLQTKPPKSSNLDTKLNVLIVVVLIFQNILLIVMASLAVWWNASNSKHWYVKYYLEQQNLGLTWIYRYLAYFILLSYLIPISLFVTLELCKVAQAKLMEWDHEMFEWMHGKWHGCTPNTSNLNEELSRVRFIFSDKTGTLTENVMTYKQGNILGNPIYSDDYEPSRAYLSAGDEKLRAAAVDYFLALSLCHTIQPFPDPENEGELKYEGSSPDEVALVSAALDHGFVLKERTTRTMTALVMGEMRKYEILATLEFTPDRKMMSIIVRDPEGAITMYTKGADSFVMPQLESGGATGMHLPDTLAVLKDMAGEGLRTLLVCKKSITKDEFAAWNERFIEVGKTIGEERSAKVDEVCLQMEKNMSLVGVTAIEDKLQDKVPETLKYFLEAHVIVWMLTGDKRETAVTIAATSSLANPLEDYVDHIDIGDAEADSADAKNKAKEQLDVIAGHIAENTKKVTFVADGPALNVCMAHHFDQFLELSQKVSSAVCCRLTPLQKARVVKMFQEATGLTALAIGDGANDVSMIQEGKVGVGIVGLEGAQAALAADYAIPRFKHLRRLCCVHGRYALVRNAICTLVSFYKNIVLSMTQFYYCFFTGFSSMTLYDGWLLSFYNFAFTSLPPLLMGIFEKDLDEQAVMDNARLFPPLGQGAYFDVPTIARWFIEAILHSIVLFFFMYPFGKSLDINEHQGIDSLMFGTVLISSMIFLALGKMALHVRYWVWQQLVGLVVSSLIFICFALLYAAIPNLFGDTSFYQSIYILMGDPKYWFYLLLFVVGLLIPIDMSIIFLQKQFLPTERDLVQEEYSHVM